MPRNRSKNLMSASGQTDAERRQLRLSQRVLQKKIASAAGESLEDPNSTALEQIRNDNNILFDKVRFTREAVLDGENLDLISGRASRQADSLIQISRYDAVKLAGKLRNKCCSKDGNSFNWNALGKEAGACFNALPSQVSFMNGPVEDDYKPKERKERKKRMREEEEEEEEEELEENKTNDADKLSAVEKHMKIMSKCLKKRITEHCSGKVAEIDSNDKEKKKAVENKTRGEGVCAIQHLFNPKSFTQTVENIFHFSFNVKNGSAGIQVLTDADGNKWPFVRATSKKDGILPRQAIVSLNMEDWRNLIKAKNVEKCDIPHRTGSRHSLNSSTSASGGH